MPTGSRSPPVRKDDELLSHAGALDSDEMCTEQEKALSEFLRLHPMLSLCAARSLPFPHTCQFINVPTKIARSASGT